MKGGVYIDAEVPALVRQQIALVHGVRGKRKRFADNSIEIVGSADEALQRAEPAKNIHAAEVMGPSRSSEGIQMYYLVRWLAD